MSRQVLASSGAVAALGLVMRAKFGVVEIGTQVEMAVHERLEVGGVLALGCLSLMAMVVDPIDQVLPAITTVSRDLSEKRERLTLIRSLKPTL